MDDDAMSMRLVPSFYGHPLVSAILVSIVVIEKKRVAIAVARVAKEGEESQGDVAIVVVTMVRFGSRCHGHNTGSKSCSGDK